MMMMMNEVCAVCIVQCAKKVPFGKKKNRDDYQCCFEEMEQRELMQWWGVGESHVRELIQPAVNMLKLKIHRSFSSIEEKVNYKTHKPKISLSLLAIP
jgi:hypothetical protein